MSHLPILIPGRTEPVNVPCSLPESMSFDVFLPDRGVRRVTAFWKSTDPLEVDTCTVALANPDTDAGCVPFDGDPYGVWPDEEQRMQDAAGDVLADVLKRLRLDHMSHGPRGDCVADAMGYGTLPHIARAFFAECEAFDAQVTAARSMPRAAGQVLWFADPRDSDPREGGVSVAQTMLRAYVGWAVEQACKAQDAKARQESEAHLPGVDEDAPGSERIMNEREVLP